LKGDVEIDVNAKAKSPKIEDGDVEIDVNVKTPKENYDIDVDAKSKHPILKVMVMLT